MFAIQNELSGKEAIATRTPACLLGRAGPESLLIVGVDSTLYLLAPGQGFLLPSGEHAALTILPSGSIAMVTRGDTMPVSGCASGTKEWVWASPFHNPESHGTSSGHVTHSDRFAGRSTQKIDGTDESKSREVPSGNNIPQDLEHGPTADLYSPVQPMPEASIADTLLPAKNADLRLYPHPPVLHILGLRHTALVELWYEGNREIYGIHCSVEPIEETVRVVSVGNVSDEQELFSLTSGHSPSGGLQIRLVSESPLAAQPFPILSVLVESRALGKEWIRLKGIIVATSDKLWSLPDDSLEVYVED